MSGEVVFALRGDTFKEFERDVTERVDDASRFPDWPFRTGSGFAHVYEYDRVLGGSFGTVLAALAAAYQDSFVTVAVFDPVAEYYQTGYDFYPAFRTHGNAIEAAYGDALRHEPGGDPTGAIAFSANVVGMAGASRSWALWGQRDWEIALLLTPDDLGPWLDAPVPAFGRHMDLGSIRSPAGWGVDLRESDLRAFWRNVRDKGSGYRGDADRP